MNAHGHHQHPEAASAEHSHSAVFDSHAFAAVLEVEGELTSTLTTEAIAVCSERFAADGHDVGRIIDLGCGPGVGTVLLARAFGSATVLAVDGSRAMLDRAEARAARAGHADRITFVQRDLNEGLASLGRCDLLWAAMTVHHAADEVATLASARSRLDRAGLLCLLERADPTSIRLADELGRPGVWDRLAAARSAGLTSVGSSRPGATNAEAYRSMITAAGLELVGERRLESTVSAPQDGATHAFVARYLTGAVRDLGDVMGRGDFEALRTFVDAMPPFPAGRWGDAEVTLSRRLFIARSDTG
jgi:ubiquinone/menaquinone biosynthesis C-methylase UbiE